MLGPRSEWNSSSVSSEIMRGVWRCFESFFAMSDDSRATRRFSARQDVQLASGIPADIVEDPLLNGAIDALLPHNYNFEIHKTIHQIRKNGATCVALQMPDGLTLWATALADIIERFTDATTVIMGDVTYGACCVDDYTAVALGCDMLVHYGHSCLIPVDQTMIKTLYVFVEISVNTDHLLASIRANFPTDRQEYYERILSAPGTGAAPAVQIEMEAAERPRTHIALVGTIQFIAAIQHIRDALTSEVDNLPELRTIEYGEHGAPDMRMSKVRHPAGHTEYAGRYRVTVPQIKPLSPGEVLGCTSPKLDPSVDAIIYVGDGRFHLESIMISNPSIPAFLYDPYTKRLQRELYNHSEMRRLRREAIGEAQETLKTPESGWGLVLGTLGRQGSTRVLDYLGESLSARACNPGVPILLSELSPQKISLFGDWLSVVVQTSCPRLSIDWGSAFPKPLLSPYEAAAALGRAPMWTDKSADLGMEGYPGQRDREEGGDYPMDFYANASLGPWTPRHGMGVVKKSGRSNRALLHYLGINARKN